MNVHSNSRQANPDSDRYDKRTAILRSTLFLVSTYGFDGTSTAMIAEDAGIGAGTIYRYFQEQGRADIPADKGHPAEGHRSHAGRL